MMGKTKTVPIVIVDNRRELEIIEGFYPHLKKAPLVLLSSSFTISQLEQFNGRGHAFFDTSLSVTDKILLVKSVQEILWTWFLDERRSDISVVNECSLGLTFINTAEIILTTLFRYLSGLSKILRPEHEVYYTDNTEDIFLDVIRFLQKEIKFNMIVVTSHERRKVIFGHRGKILMDPNSRKRDQSWLFQANNWRSFLLRWWLKITQKSLKRENRILMMHAGKMEHFLSYLKKEGSSLGKLQYILPLNHADLFRILNIHDRKSLYFVFDACRRKSFNHTNGIISVLKQNIRKRVRSIDPNLLITVFDRYMFRHFPGALRYFLNAVEFMKSLQPDLVVLPSESYEDHILVAQAAKKLNIKTAIMPHGLHGYGYREYKNGSMKLFDFAIAFGKSDASDYIQEGMNERAIYIAPFPGLNRFLTEHRSGSMDYESALILPLDFLGNCAAEQIQEHYNYLTGVVNLLIELNIKIVGIKFRYQANYKNMGYAKDFFIYKGIRVNLIGEEKTFAEVAHESDFIIGPLGSSMVEAGLIGKDFYAYSHTNFCQFDPKIHSAPYRISNVALSLSELKENISRKSPYKPDCSVFDYVELEDIRNDRDLYSKFDTAIFKCFGTDLVHEH